MRLDGDRLVIETVKEGIVAADAADFAEGDGLTEMYRHLTPDQLPITMGRIASLDAMRGLRSIAGSPGLSVGDYLDSTNATGYLALIELNG